MTHSAPALLDISTLIERPSIEIDGTRYQVRHPHELSIVESLRFGRLADEVTALQKSGDDPDKLEELVSTIARDVLPDVPDDLFGKLSGMQKLAIAEVFTGLLLQTRVRAAGAIGQALEGPRAGVSSGSRTSHGSSGSSAAPRRSGLLARLLRSSALT